MIEFLPCSPVENAGRVYYNQAAGTFTKIKIQSVAGWLAFRWFLL